jgi:hypothetical protein
MQQHIIGVQHCYATLSDQQQASTGRPVQQQQQHLQRRQKQQLLPLHPS